jgi:hypothetical protein
MDPTGRRRQKELRHPVISLAVTWRRSAFVAASAACSRREDPAAALASPSAPGTRRGGEAWPAAGWDQSPRRTRRAAAAASRRRSSGCRAPSSLAPEPSMATGDRRAAVMPMLGGDPPGFGMRVGDRPAGIGRPDCRRCARCAASASAIRDSASWRVCPEREDPVDIRAMGTPGGVFSLLVDAEVVLQRRSAVLSPAGWQQACRQER